MLCAWETKVESRLTTPSDFEPTMDLIKLGRGTTETCWNDSGTKMAAGTDDGTLYVYELDNGSRSFFVNASQWKAHNNPIGKLAWAPSEFGNVLACCSTDGSLSVWEENEESGKIEWRLCMESAGGGVSILDVQFGNCSTGLKLVSAGADGLMRVYEASNVLEMSDWQLQAEFSNVTDVRDSLEKTAFSAASISWRPPTNALQHPVFVVGFRTQSSRRCFAKIWEFGEAHQRWHVVAELTAPNYESGLINHVSWAPNIGRSYELISVASSTSLSVWSVRSASSSGTLPSVKMLYSFADSQGEVRQAEWDMTGTTLASTGSDGAVKLWQSNYKGDWEMTGIVEGTSA